MMKRITYNSAHTISTIAGLSFNFYLILSHSKKDYESKMETYLNSYKELKAHYKELLQDLTRKFEGAFESLHKEKCELQAENEILRNSAAGDGLGKLL